MEPARILRRKLENKQPAIGLLFSYHLWLDAIEMAIEVGLDYIIVDSEHLDHGGREMADACSAGRMAGFPVIVRPTATDLDTIRLAMDLGPCGLLLPMVESTQQLDEVQKGIYMPPRGERRPGGRGNRWLRQFGYEPFRSIVEDHLIVIPQIESPKGLEQVDAIARHPIVTALGIGPFDLSARLGVCWEPDHPKIVQAKQKIRHAAEEAGKPMWVIGDPRKCAADGYTFICAGEPIGLLQGLIKGILDDVRG
jgi:4-hydroxy-2-oxoheptanedioate aldolase